MRKKKKMELLAPVGNFESLTAALQAGCDSVYFGVEQLNMRAKSTINFTVDDLPEIVKRCEKKNVKSYITLNTIIYDHDLTIAKTILKAAKNAGISAIIASDQAVISQASSLKIPIHISTQLNITNVETVRFYSHFADVMVLSRELSLAQTKHIVTTIEEENITGPSGDLVRVEIFGHGALCMAVSGKCYLSLHTQNSSANRGACVQNCRRKYTVIDENGHELEIDNEYIMSPKDLCTIDILDTVISAGVSVLKIEGRGKGADYVFKTIECYRKAIDAYYNGKYTKALGKSLKEELKTVYNRGFWEGYYLGRKYGEWNDEHGSKSKTKKIFVGKGVHYFSKIGVAEIEVTSYDIKVGDTLMVIGPTTGVIEEKVTEIQKEKAAVSIAKKGEHISIPFSKKIRPSDKVYKIVTS